MTGVPVPKEVYLIYFLHNEPINVLKYQFLKNV